MAYTEEQKAAICHKDGPMLVLAGPGSGKTTVITRRISYLIENGGVYPGNILVITFTKAAAKEMEGRFQSQHPQIRGRVNFGTFHAVFFKILKMSYGYDGNSILKEEERNKILRELIHTKVETDCSDEKELMEAIASEISLVKNEGFQLQSYYSANCPDEVFRDIFNCYEAELHKLKKIDFDDMLVQCYRLLSKQPDILEQWQKKYQYILVDEFQDINRIQYDIVKILALPQNNLFIVGDDDQSIYSFRGAKPELMQIFAEDYPEAAKVTLSCNFRSTQPIVSAALQLIAHNHRRFEKKLYAATEKGEAVEIRQYSQRRQECAEIAEEIAVLHKTGLAWKDIAVLYRTNLQTRSIMSKFMEYNIPFQTRDAVPNLYEHWVCRDIVSYIRFALGDRSRFTFLQIMNRPKRYIARETLDSNQVDFAVLKQVYSEKEYVLDRLEKLEYDLAMLQGLNPFAAVNYIRRAVGYDSFLTEYASYRKMNAEELFEVLADLQEDAAEYRTYEAWFTHMEEYKERLRLEHQKEKSKDTDAVMLTTYHSAKGLEFHTVFLPEANEELTPHRQAVLEEDIEEERRMFYVAMTRAKRRLVISSMKELRMKTMAVSRFVKEATGNGHSLKEGDRVFHSVYGFGTVSKAGEERLCIRFDRFSEEKEFNEAYCVERGLLKKVIQ